MSAKTTTLTPNFPRVLALFLALAFFLMSTSAWAIDGYKDRRGAFFGVGLGGGPGAVHVQDDAFTTGLDDGGQLGLHLNAIAGGGVTENITFGAELNTWIRTVNVQGNSLNHQQWSLLAASDFFLFEGFFVGAGLGLGYGFSDAASDGVQTRRYQEMGLAFKGTTGYEFFVNGTVAMGLRFSYTRHVYQEVDFDTFQGAFTFRWY